MSRCVFLDRDGVLNKDNPNYTYTIENFEVMPGVVEALQLLKRADYLLVVVTNQSGIDKGIYTIDQMKECHAYFQQVCDGLIDYFYFSPYHRSINNSLLTKPGTLMFEKGIARFGIDVNESWMIGDRGRDLIPAKTLGIRTIQIGDEVEPENRGDFVVNNLSEATQIILNSRDR